MCLQQSGPGWGGTENKDLTCHVWLLDLNLTSVKRDPENLGAVARSDVCVGNSFGSILEELVDRTKGKLWGPALGQRGRGRVEVQSK